jgi:hypothetical protein
VELSSKLRKKVNVWKQATKRKRKQKRKTPAHTSRGSLKEVVRKVEARWDIQTQPPTPSPLAANYPPSNGLHPHERVVRGHLSSPPGRDLLNSDKILKEDPELGCRLSGSPLYQGNRWPTAGEERKEVCNKGLARVPRIIFSKA